MFIPKDMKRKDRRKVIRTTIQVLICLGFILGGVIHAYVQPIYDTSNESNWNHYEGFSVISYPGVSNHESETLISKQQLEKHFQSLQEAGYETVGLEDILNFYETGAPLPNQGLLILFEDGRRETYLNVQPLLEQYNFKATMMTYGYDLINGDRSRLKKNDLSLLEKSSYWEIGSNGYRFSKINVQKINSADGEEISQYKHYLLDYLRDQDQVPIEKKDEMIQRISWDYDQMTSIYKEGLEHSPILYKVMHSDALFGNMNHAVEAVNLEKIYEGFQMMLNREGSCYNSMTTPVYNLTKMSVQPNWDAKDLLTQLSYWTNSESSYDTKENSLHDWYLKEGELNQEALKLKLVPNQHQRGVAVLKGALQDDLNLSFYLPKLEVGAQSVYLRYDEFENTYIKVSLKHHVLKVIQRTSDGGEQLLYEKSTSLEEMLQERGDELSILSYKMDSKNLISPLSWKLGLQLKGTQLMIALGGKGEVVEIDSSISKGQIVLEGIEATEFIYDELKIESE